MKKLFLMFSVVATTLALGSCSSDEPSSGTKGELGEPQFLTVNLVTNTNSGSRADAEPEGAEYEAGLDAENKVKKVRFYFFDASGNAAAVRNENGTFVNYLDWEDISEEGDNMPNVEKILSATLVIQSPKGDGEPAQLLAIINPTDGPNEERTLTSVATVKRNYQLYNTSGKFVMSNSTFAKDGKKMMAVSVEGKIHKTSGEALNDPVQIYVERTIAKVRLNNSLTPAGKENIFKTSDDGSQKVDLGDGEQEIFVSFLGWNTTAVADLTRLVKEINPAWPETLFGNGGPWNWAGYNRCFWAVNASGVKYLYGAFNTTAEGTSETPNLNTFQANANTKFDKSQWVYVNENATDNNNLETGDNPATPTKVIIAAQLVDSEGNPLEFAEYGSTRTTIEGLKTLFANNCGLYKKEVVDGETIFTKITPDDLIIKTATAIGEAAKNKDGRYKVYVQLAENKDNVWYASNNENATPITADAANAQLKSLGSAKVWKDGYTYYYFDIKHIGEEKPGVVRKGVVRNHIYDANITKLVGLGTPIYDPEEVIYPEQPDDDDDTFIAAQINVLSWRVVKSDVELDWVKK